MKARVLSLEDLKQLCNEYLEVLLTGSEEECEHFGEDVEVRFINEDGSFGYWPLAVDATRRACSRSAIIKRACYCLLLIAALDIGFFNNK